MFTSEVKIRVRYAETDQMGYVYYGNYGAYFEVARTETFRQLGISYKRMEEEGVMMPVLEMRAKYVKPARYDDLLTVKLLLRKRPTGARILFEYEVYNEAQELLTVGETTMVFVKISTNRPTAMPQDIHDKLDHHFNG